MIKTVLHSIIPVFVIFMYGCTVLGIILVALGYIELHPVNILFLIFWILGSIGLLQISNMIKPSSNKRR